MKQSGSNNQFMDNKSTKILQLHRVTAAKARLGLLCRCILYSYL